MGRQEPRASTGAGRTERTGGGTCGFDGFGAANSFNDWRSPAQNRPRGSGIRLASGPSKNSDRVRGDLAPSCRAFRINRLARHRRYAPPHGQPPRVQQTTDRPLCTGSAGGTPSAHPHADVVVALVVCRFGTCFPWCTPSRCRRRCQRRVKPVRRTPRRPACSPERGSHGATSSLHCFGVENILGVPSHFPR